MKALIVYDSVFGNTEKLALAMADALDANALKAADVKTADLDGLTLLIAASPTRAFSPMPTIKGWIKSLPAGSLSGIKVAAFDTRMSMKDVDSKFLTFMVRVFGYAAEPMSKALVKKGGSVATQPDGFIVGGNEGPLKDGELQRAIEWAKNCA